MDRVEIDVTMVAACRPDLLAVTLASFADRIFRNFSVRRVFANIDPVWGSAADGDRCESLLREYYPEADIARPPTPSFGQAVKSVWGKTGELPVFHMEDDWAALASITPDMVLPHLEPDVGMVALAQKARGPRDADFVKRAKRIRVLGVAVGRKLVNGYGTSPRFIAAGLAARYAELMNPRLDPEKQVYTDSNKRLSKLQEKFRCRQIWAHDSSPLIKDLGRDWRVSRNIGKVYRKAEVSWVDHNHEP